MAGFFRAGAGSSPAVSSTPGLSRGGFSAVHNACISLSPSGQQHGTSREAFPRTALTETTCYKDIL